MADPVITLLTDFGTRDAYVGVMKGVIASRCPAARVIDLTHDLAPGDVTAAGYLLSTAWRYFPQGTVHVAVVDPGVGSERAILAASLGGQYFIAPDNGLLSAVFDDHEPQRVVRVESESVRLAPVSQTFHGRDIFAPAGAALAGGAALGELGPAVEHWVSLPHLVPAEDARGALVGQIVHIDRFGNLITNIAADDVPAEATIEIGDRAIHGVRRSYASVSRGELLAIIGSAGRLEISVNRGDAAAMLRVECGTDVRVTRHDDSPPETPDTPVTPETPETTR